MGVIVPETTVPSVSPDDRGLQRNTLALDKVKSPWGEHAQLKYDENSHQTTVTIDLKNIDRSLDSEGLFFKTVEYPIIDMSKEMGSLPTEMIMIPRWGLEVTGMLDIYNSGVYLTIDTDKRIGMGADGKIVCLNNVGHSIEATPADLKALKDAIAKADTGTDKVLTKRFADKIQPPTPMPTSSRDIR